MAGFTRCGTAAFLGSLWGTDISAVIALVVAGPFRLNGAVRPFSETLRFGGFDHLNLTRISLAGTFLASSGAIMDLAIDIAAAMEEVHRKRPELGYLQLLASGFTVGRNVFGTMTTTAIGLHGRIHQPAYGVHGPGRALPEHVQLELRL